MNFQTVDYMYWAKTAGADCDLLLSVSGLTPPPGEWLGSISTDDALHYHEAYGDPALKEAIAHEYGGGVGEVLTATGTSEANFLVCAALLKPGQKVALELPFYQPMRRVVEALGAEVLMLERSAASGYGLPVERVAALLEQGVKLIVLTDLHNPTGAVLNRETLATVISLVERADAWMLIDEVYLDFLFDRRPPSAHTLSERVVVTSSLTKAYGLGALRCGWALGAASVIDRAYQIRDYLGVQATGPSTLLSRQAFQVLERLQAWTHWRVAAGRAIMDRYMSLEPRLRWVPPAGGIMGLLSLPGGLSGHAVSTHLKRHHRTLVTPGEFFGAPGTIRVGFGTEPALLEDGLQRLSATLDALLERRL